MYFYLKLQLTARGRSGDLNTEYSVEVLDIRVERVLTTILPTKI